jgi:hypothetical protein
MKGSIRTRDEKNILEFGATPLTFCNIEASFNSSSSKYMLIGSKQ